MNNIKAMGRSFICCHHCQNRQYTYSDELQNEEYSKITSTPRRPRRRCLKKCCLCSVVIVGVTVLCVFYLAPLIKRKLKCLYQDTGSEDIGSPNFYLSCGASKEDCQYYGYEYHSSDYNSECCKGEKVHLCVYPKHPPAPQPTPANQFQYLTWNVFQRPYEVSGDGQVERTCYIPRWVANHYPNADAVTFQELFTEGCWGDRSSVREMLKSHGFLYSTRPVKADMHVHTAGIFLASKWPIEHQEELVFGYKNIKTIKNFFIPKGAVYAKIRKKVGDEEQIYHLVGLHLFSNRGELNKEARISQVKDILALLERQNISQADPVLIAGDFNQDLIAQKEEREEVFKILSAALPRNISSLSYSFDRTINKLNIDANPPDWPQEWLDYVLYMTSHKIPKNATLDSIPARSENPISMCWHQNKKNWGIHHIPKPSDCDNIRNYTDLSDHYTAIGTFIF